MSDATHDESTDPRARLDSRNEAAWALHEKCLYASAVRISTEVRRTASAERQLLPLLRANFHLMNAARSTLEPRTGRDAAVENIAFLESPDKARQFQGDVDEAELEHTVHWMSSCSYDNLAVATALGQGYNSDGMQACIADGIGVCRRTGKTECVTCFREYAVEVHRSADDLDMALHFARQNKAVTDARNDRRWAAHDDEADLLMLAGQLPEAWDAGRRAWDLAPTYHSPLAARRQTGVLLAELAMVAGRDDWAAAVPSLAADATPRGEDLLQDLRDDQVAAIRHAAGGDYAAAAKLLIPWDKVLTDKQNLHHWLETRLRVVALYLMAGQRAKAEAVAKPLKERATKAKDYLTLRRLAGMMDGTVPVAPVPLVGAASKLNVLNAASRDESHGESEPAAAVVAPDAAPAEPPTSPLRGTVESLAQGLQAALRAAAETGEAPDFAEPIARILAVTDAPAMEDAASLIHLASMAADISPSTDHDTAIWAWARSLQGRQHLSNGPVMNAIARLADVLRQKTGSPVADDVTEEQVGQWYKRSLELDANQPNGFGRAGDFFLGQGDAGEAERCYARAFRLDRTNAHVARQLSRIYSHTDRPSDGLAVMDMCLREGGESADLLFDAGLAAFAQGRYQQAVSYLDRLNEVSPGGRWVHYYRAASLLELNRPADALAAIDDEAAGLAAYEPDEGEIPPTTLHVHCVRAAALSALGQPADAAAAAEAALGVRISHIGDLSPAGVAANLRRLRAALESVPGHDELKERLDRRLLAAGMMPDEYFEARRKQNPKAGELTHFVVALRQPLGPEWAQDEACPPGAGDWTEASYRYGVLAADDEEAGRRVVAQHEAALFEAAAEVVAVMPTGGPFDDHPGVTSMASPEPPTGEEGDEEEGETDDNAEEESDPT